MHLTPCAPIWAFAKASGKALINMAPEDLHISFGGPTIPSGGQLRVEATMHTAHEAEALIEIIRHLSHRCLSSAREMVSEDIMPAVPPKTLSERMADAGFGPL